jgi:regulator of replication initiation timing
MQLHTKEWSSASTHIEMEQCIYTQRKHLRTKEWRSASTHMVHKEGWSICTKKRIWKYAPAIAVQMTAIAAVKEKVMQRSVMMYSTHTYTLTRTHKLTKMCRQAQHTHTHVHTHIHKSVQTSTKSQSTLTNTHTHSLHVSHPLLFTCRWEEASDCLHGRCGSLRRLLHGHGET